MVFLLVFVLKLLSDKSNNWTIHGSLVLWRNFLGFHLLFYPEHLNYSDDNEEVENCCVGGFLNLSWFNCCEDDYICVGI